MSHGLHHPSRPIRADRGHLDKTGTRSIFQKASNGIASSQSECSRYSQLYIERGDRSSGQQAGDEYAYSLSVRKMVVRTEITITSNGREAYRSNPRGSSALLS